MPDQQVGELIVPQGTFALGRPSQGRAPVRAWDAADEYALAFVDGLAHQDGATLVINDGFGAIVTALGRHGPVLSLGDSVVAFDVAIENLGRNGVDPQRCTLIPSLGAFPVESTGIGLAIVKVPKMLSLLEQQLRRIRPLLRADAVVVGAGMTRHIHNSTTAAFGSIIGPTTTSLAKKKARLIHSTVSAEPPLGPDGDANVESERGATYDFEGLAITTYPGVFSQQRVDQGTRLLADYLTSRRFDQPPEQIVDLGCGNGILGIAAGQAYTSAQVTFVDVSFNAVESARTSWNDAFASTDRATFVPADGLDGPARDVIEPGSVDLIVNNPPFHEGHNVGDDIAWKMFGDAHRALRSGGTLLVVGNRHLGYHTKLKRRFGNCETVSSDSKFVVLKAQR